MLKHRTALTTALSLVSVGLAGTVAFAANLGILESNPRADDVSTVVSLPTTSSTLTETSSTLTETTKPIEESSSKEVAYQIPGVGIVTLTVTDNSLEVASVEAAGWEVEQKSGSDDVEIKLTSGDRVITFKAELDDGEVSVDVVEGSLTAPPPEPPATTATTAPNPVTQTSDPGGTSTTIHDDDDDDDHGEDIDEDRDEDHDDDDEDREDDEHEDDEHEDDD